MTDKDGHEYLSLPDLIDDLKPHDHLCLIYESREEWQATVVPFISSGLKRGEKCIYVVDANTASQIKEVLKEAGLAVDDYESKGQLSIIHERDTYTREGYFDPDLMIALLIEETKNALREGYPALRVTGEMSWALRDYGGVEKVLEYEAKLNKDLFPDYPCVAICQYDRWKFDPEIIKGVVMTHPLLIRGGHIYRNYYYVEPDEYLKNKKGEIEVNLWLNNLERERKAQESLRESEEKFKAIANYTVGWESWFGPDGKYLWVNNAVEKFTGYSPSEILAMPDFISILIAEEDRAIFKDRMSEAIGGSQGENFEFRYLHKNGTKRWLSASWQPIFDTKGNFLGARASGQDITERKQAEEALRVSEEKFRHIFKHSPIGIYYTNSNGVITDCNEVFVKSMGSTFDALVGLDILSPCNHKYDDV